jgi:uncharacterized protein
VSENLRVVFDTQVFLRALINPKSACGKLFHIWQSYYALHVSDAIEAEIKDVLTRPIIRAKFPQIDDKSVDFVLETLKMAYRVEITGAIEAVSRDPKDDIFLACAKTAQARYLVSEDKDLLVLIEHYGAKVINVVTFLTILEELKSEM